MACAMVEHSPHQHKVEGLIPVSADNNRREKKEKKSKGNNG